MPRLLIRATEVYFDGVVIVDRVAQISPCYRLWRGLILDTVLGPRETFNYTSTTPQN